MSFNFQFNANQVDPATGGSSLPVGKYPSIISDIEVTGTKDNNNGVLKITHKVTSGDHVGQTMIDRLNLWHSNQQTVEIAGRALSAICHVTGVMVINSLEDLQRLKGIPMGIDVGLQKQPQNLPDGMTPEAWKAKAYTEVKGYFDRDGNAPKKGQPVNGGAQTGSNNGPGANFGGGNSQPQNNNQPPQNQPQNNGGGGGNWGNNNNAGNAGNAGGGNAGPAWGGGNAGGGGNQNPPQNEQPQQAGNTAGGWGNSGGGGNTGGGGSWPGNNS